MSIDAEDTNEIYVINDIDVEAEVKVDCSDTIDVVKIYARVSSFADDEATLYECGDTITVGVDEMWGFGFFSTH